MAYKRQLRVEGSKKVLQKGAKGDDKWAGFAGTTAGTAATGGRGPFQGFSAVRPSGPLQTLIEIEFWSRQEGVSRGTASRQENHGTVAQYARL